VLCWHFCWHFLAAYSRIAAPQSGSPESRNLVSDWSVADTSRDVPGYRTRPVQIADRFQPGRASADYSFGS